MPAFELLCVTMHQKDFSKIREMNIRSDVVFANQADRTAYEEMVFGKHTAKMITTETRGVGKNRNIALTYATADICLLADDDAVYDDDAAERIMAEFAAHPRADVMIFHFDTEDAVRKQARYSRTRRWLSRKAPWGAFRIAFRLNAIRKANVWFTTLFGGGCPFPSGEDSMFLLDLRKAGLRFYVSKETIGRISFEASSWYTGNDAKYYYGKGAFYQAAHPGSKYLWMLYFALRTPFSREMKMKEKLIWMNRGTKGYRRW